MLPQEQVNEFYKAIHHWLRPLGFKEIYSNHPSLDERTWDFAQSKYDHIRIQTYLNISEQGYFLVKEIHRPDQEFYVLRTLTYPINDPNLLEHIDKLDDSGLSSKRPHVKPQFYAHCLEKLKAIAQEMGYNLVVHGSLERDMDLIAIPWVHSPEDELALIHAFNSYLTGNTMGTKEDYLFQILPGGRHSYVINLNRGGSWNNYVDEQYYLDISVTPLIVT